MNVFNQVIPSMNPQELSTMVWMGQFASPLDENLTNLYGQPMPASAMMDDITQSAPSMDINPAAIGSLIGDYSGHVTAISTPTGGGSGSAGTADGGGIGGINLAAALPNPELALTNPELFNLQQQQLQLQQQLSLGNYAFLAAAQQQAGGGGAAGGAVIVGGPTVVDEDDDLLPTRMIDDEDEPDLDADTGEPELVGDALHEPDDDEDDDEEQAMQTYEQYQRMVEAGSEFLSVVTGQEEHLLSYTTKLMNEAQLLQQPQGSFLDYDPSGDGGTANGDESSSSPVHQSSSAFAEGGIGVGRLHHHHHHSLLGSGGSAAGSGGGSSGGNNSLLRASAATTDTASSNSSPAIRFPNKKIKPVKRPGLVLKTPIAYKGDIDPSVIPIQRDGMAICEKCGAIGVKHSFYTKQRRFCSMTCARSFDALRLYTNTGNGSSSSSGNANSNNGSSSSNSALNSNNNNTTSHSGSSSNLSAVKALSSTVSTLDDSTIPSLGTPSALPPEQLIDDSADEDLSSSASHVASVSAAGGVETLDSKHQLFQQQQQHQVQQQQAALQQQIQLQQQLLQVQNISYRFKMSQIGTDNSNLDVNSDKTISDEIIPQDEIPQLPRGTRLPSPCPQEERIISIRRKPSEFINSYDWTPALSDPNFFAAPVICFRHAPGYEMWPNVVIGMKVEVENTDCDSGLGGGPLHGGLGQHHSALIGGTPHSFWVATVLRICGYKALLRYEGFDTDASKDFWVNLCSSEVHPVGWCATRGKPLIPPKSIAKPYKDWKEFLVKRLSNARTLPSTFYNKISESFRSRFRVGLNLEVVDKNRISQVKLAAINKIVGKRLYVRYYDSPPDDNGFWCHEDSPLIHPVGWATTVGHNLAAPEEYMERMNAARDQILQPNEDDATMDLFKTNFHFEEYYLEGKQTGFEEGMKLEAVDPLNLSSICVATVMSVLKFGYIMIRIDSYDPDVSGADWFCYHEKSPCIFPVGFCNANEITLTPPKGYDLASFTWEQYLIDTNSKPATEDLFHRDIIRQKFKVGMKLESADLMDPRLICVATISRVVGRLLKVHFDGWDDEYDQWLDSESPDIYPIGWCVLVGHKLEGPRILPKLPPAQKISPKTTTKKGKRKKKIMKFELAGTGEPLRTASIKKEQQDSFSEQQQQQLKLLGSQTQQQHQQQAHHQQDIAYSITQLQNKLDQMQYTLATSVSGVDGTGSPLDSGGVTSAAAAVSLLSTIKHEPHQLADPQILGPIFDQSTPTTGTASDSSGGGGGGGGIMDGEGSTSVGGDGGLMVTGGDDDMSGLKTEDEDGESNSATGNPSSAPSEITDIEMEKVIPRLIGESGSGPGGSGGSSGSGGSGSGSSVGVGVSGGNNGGNNSSASPEPQAQGAINPDSWDVKDVAAFLTVNDCSVHCEPFLAAGIDGRRLLQLSKDDIITILGMKVGPSLKIHDLIQQLKCKIDPSKSRLLKSSLGKKFL